MHENNLDERTLVEQARKDPQAFGRLFDRYYDPILNYILHRTAEVHVARELASNTFYTALRKLWQFKWRTVPFSAWLYRIAANEVNMHYRKRKTAPATLPARFAHTVADENGRTDSEIMQAEQHLAEHRVFLEMHTAIEKLKPRYQEVLVLKYFENKKISEIAQIVGKPEGTIKSLLHRAYGQLRTKLQPLYLEEMSE